MPPYPNTAIPSWSNSAPAPARSPRRSSANSPARGRHLAIEIDPQLAHHLSRRHPAAEVLQHDAADLRQLLAERDIDRADVVISALPWSLFPSDTQDRLMDATAAVLGPSGAFTAFTYLHAVPLPPARRFRDQLTDRFEEVVPSQTIWRNAPPPSSSTPADPASGRNRAEPPREARRRGGSSTGTLPLAELRSGTER
ncbi:class I SAM-dependent methyltransferase [Streptomyces diastatochromogenes]|uniref:class I SAM-dependent methyltransferase n=1 Tax=Streptomyces diastatochromogenes TaxID=42236 RepID=UPI001ABFD4A9|nr:hypothetical protein [Streptomyces diastatochromogenes]MCZ0991061.1 hypothetical protein [Streptomyces diastatochromogenes]